MRKFSIAAVFAFLLLSGNPFVADAQMTDQAIIEYVKTHTENGEDEKTIARALLQNGVTVDQLKEIKARYEAQRAGKLKSAEAVIDAQTGAKGRESAYEETAQQPGNARQTASETGSSMIFGHDIFSGRTLTFEPNENVATPSNYVLGPGDRIVIDLWGMNEAKVEQTISPEGRIMISQIGPIYLSGLTIDQASAKIRREFARKYAGVEGMNPSSEISVTLAGIRTIQVNIMGEVNTPGTYRLSPFSNVFNAIYKAGGITDAGSLRRVKVVRSGRQVNETDVYKYIFTGETGGDFRLEDGDVIIVPPYESLVAVSGEVKRPMKYELVEGETLEKVINFAGGYSGKALKSDISVIRRTDKEYRIVTVRQADVPSFRMMDGDSVNVDELVNRFENMIEIKGCVYHPGVYELGGDIATVRQLVDHASGVREDAYLERVLIIRERPDLTYETNAVNLRRILSGEAPDFLLKKNDVVIVSSASDLHEQRYISVIGFVRNPGDFAYADNTTLKDAIFQAGGLLDGASTARIDVTRRISNPSGVSPTDTMSEVFTYSLPDGLDVNGLEDCILQPYDVVTVRKSPEYKEQRFVNISGEVAFEGDYAITSNNERLSDIVRRAGGLTEHAYVRGARLVRSMTQDEESVRKATLDMIENGVAGKDSVKVGDSFLSSTYTVGIDLEKALASPGSDFDLVIRQDDSIIIPEYVGTVKIQGTVMYPNTVVYIPGKPLSYYIDQAGGFGHRAKRAAVYVVHMNGNVSRVHSASDIQPGCEIIVPRKPEKREMSTAEVLSIGSSTASIAAVIATIVNLTRK